MIEFYINGTQVVSPINWEDLSLRLNRDRDAGTLLFTCDSTLEFSFDGAALLKTELDAQGFCGTLPIQIIDTAAPVSVLYQGTLFLSSCEINEETGSVKVKVEDTSFYKSINNNKNIETALNAGKSKDGTVIDPAEACIIGVHKHSQNTDVRSVHTVRVYEAFRYLTEFMSNGALSFASDTFDVSGDWEGLVITSGQKLRGATGYSLEVPALPMLSFQKLFTEVRKKIPIALTIENGHTLRIEAESYFSQDGTTTTAYYNLDKIITKFDQERLYSAVRVGSETIENAGDFPETQDAIGFKEEQFFSQVECNIDRELDLVSGFIISSNVINDCVDILSDEYDEDWFFLTCTLSTATTGSTTRDDLFGTGDYFFNDALRNINVLQRQLGGVPSTLNQYFGEDDPSFKAICTADDSTTRTVVGAGTTGGTGTIGPAAFDNDSSYLDAFDTNGVYEQSVNMPPVRYNVFVAPADGLYGFEVFCDFEVTTNETGAPAFTGAGTITVQGDTLTEVMNGIFQYNLYDSGGVSLGTNSQDVFQTNYFKSWFSIGGTSGTGWSTNYYPLGNGYTQSQPFTFSLYMQAGWQLVVTPVAAFADYAISGAGNWGTLSLEETITLKTGSFFRCYSSSLSDLEIEVQEITDFIIRKHEFQTPMTITEFNDLKNNSRSRVPFSMHGEAVRFGWIDEVSYSKGMASIKLSSKNS